MKKLAVALLVAVACLAIGAVGAPGAKVHKYKTKVTIAFDNTPAPYGGFHGKVKSKKKACRKHRKVSVKQQLPGTDPTIGSDTSNNKGQWAVTLNVAPTPGDYYALAKKKKLHHGKIVCKKGKSPTISVP